MNDQSRLPRLYIFSGLPGTGKSTLAMRLAQETGALYMRIDTVEQALHELCNYSVKAEGYQLSYRLISDNLRLGVSAIADSCNTIKLTRDEWEQVATRENAVFFNIEIRCSDSAEHRRRAELRTSDPTKNHTLTWEQIQNRHYEPWHKDVTIIDTAGKSIEQSFSELTFKLSL